MTSVPLIPSTTGIESDIVEILRWARGLAGLALALPVALVCCAPAARAAEPSEPTEPSEQKPARLEAVLRGGAYGVDGHLGAMAGVEVGARLSRRVFVGGFFNFGTTSWSGYPCWGTCTDVTRQLGVEAQLHPLEPDQVDLWLGLGTGYQWGLFEDTKGTARDGLALLKYRVWLGLSAQLGVDFPLGALRAGLFAGFSVASADPNVVAPLRVLGGARLVF